MIAGIDLGGTQARVALARPDGRIVRTRRTPTGSLGGPMGLVNWASEALDSLRNGDPLNAVGVGAAGPVDQVRGRLVNPPNLPGWRDVPLAADLSRKLSCPVHLENDANVAALAEFHQGAGRGARTMIYITWSTGVGGGLVIDGRLFSGAHGSAGEIGHMILDPDGPLDGCGQRGCLEAFCGGGSLERQTGMTAAEIFEGAAAGRPEAAGIVRRAAAYMGQALVSLTNIIDPEVIVIGGGVTRSWSQVGPALKEALRGSPFIRPGRRPHLRRARLGDRVGEVGAVEWARANL
ncbi:MAG: ROK family protein [Candidatus Dormibacteraeota bacterium]|nr:ROK family protein [Candidatus Dormibacteraeota bacterium]